MSLEHKLEIWVPPVFDDTHTAIYDTPAPSIFATEQFQEWLATLTYTDSTIPMAMAYRESALICLYGGVFQPPRLLQIPRRATIALNCCLAAVNHSGFLHGLLWPLFIASCQAIIPKTRALSTTIFKKLEICRGMPNISRAFSAVQEVWKRYDLAEYSDFTSLFAEHWEVMCKTMDGDLVCI